MSASFAPIPGFATTMRVVRPGSGPTVTKGDTVVVHARGVVRETNAKFWSTKDPGQKPFEYRAGVGAVITGWDQGCLGAKVGEIRELIIPAEEGYVRPTRARSSRTRPTGDATLHLQRLTSHPSHVRDRRVKGDFPRGEFPPTAR